MALEAVLDLLDHFPDCQDLYVVLHVFSLYMCI